jgi:hypothetical protein
VTGYGRDSIIILHIGLQRQLLTVFSVHYRGSIGFGADSIDSLLGNVGTQDVRDVQVRDL